MAWKFLNVGKANSEIERLNAEVATVTKERDEARAALESNASEVAKAAEELQTQLDTANKSVATLTGQVKELTGQLVGKDAEIAGLKSQIAISGKAVATQVATKVAEVQAALGAPAAPAVPAAAKPAAANNLTGMARIRAAAGQDLQAAGYIPKN